MRDKLNALAAKAVALIQAHPLRYVAGAAVVGYILGAL